MRRLLGFLTWLRRSFALAWQLLQAAGDWAIENTRLIQALVITVSRGLLVIVSAYGMNVLFFNPGNPRDIFDLFAFGGFFYVVAFVGIMAAKGVSGTLTRHEAMRLGGFAASFLFGCLFIFHGSGPMELRALPCAITMYRLLQCVSINDNSPMRT